MSLRGAQRLAGPITARSCVLKSSLTASIWQSLLTREIVANTSAYVLPLRMLAVPFHSGSE